MSSRGKVSVAIAAVQACQRLRSSMISHVRVQAASASVSLHPVPKSAHGIALKPHLFQIGAGRV